MKLDSFLKEHGLKIENLGKVEQKFVLIRHSDKAKISPECTTKDAVVFWIKNNTNEIFFKLYNEE